MNNVWGDFHLVSGVIGTIDGSWTYTQRQLGGPNGHGLGWSTDHRTQLRTTFALDATPYAGSHLPCANGAAPESVSEYAVVRNG